jgi:hypothetical protein
MCQNTGSHAADIIPAISAQSSTAAFWSIRLPSRMQEWVAVP